MAALVEPVATYICLIFTYLLALTQLLSEQGKMDSQQFLPR
jgi:hypothetical protein